MRSQVDPFVFPVRHGCERVVSSRLLNFELRHWPSFFLDVIFLQETGACAVWLRYWLETSAYKNEVYLLATQFDEKVAELHFQELGTQLCLHVNFAGCPQCGVHPAQKIRAESASNGSELRSAGFTPHKIRAELSSNGSSRSHPALAESLCTRASFKLRSSVAHALRESYLKVRRVRLRQQRHRS